MNPTNLKVATGANGRISLTTETSRSIESSYNQGLLLLTFATSSAIFHFTGTKN